MHLELDVCALATVQQGAKLAAQGGRGHLRPEDFDYSDHHPLRPVITYLPSNHNENESTVLSLEGICQPCSNSRKDMQLKSDACKIACKKGRRTDLDEGHLGDIGAGLAR